MNAADFQRQTRALILAGKWEPLRETGRSWSQSDQEAPLARLCIIAGALFKGDYREAHEQHKRLFNAHLPGDLRTFAEQLAREHPDNSGARLFFGITLAQVGDLEAAIREYKEGARLAPEDAFAHYFQGQALH